MVDDVAQSVAVRHHAVGRRGASWERAQRWSGNEGFVVNIMVVPMQRPNDIASLDTYVVVYTCATVVVLHDSGWAIYAVVTETQTRLAAVCFPQTLTCTREGGLRFAFPFRGGRGVQNHCKYRYEYVHIWHDRDRNMTTRSPTEMMFSK